MLEELSQEEVSRVMGSAPSFSEDYTDATDEVSNAFSHLKITLDNSTREVNKSSLASRVPPSYSGSYRTAAVAKGVSIDLSYFKIFLDLYDASNTRPPIYLGKSIAMPTEIRR